MKAKMILLFLLFGGMAGSAGAEDPVYFQDPILQAAVEEALSTSNPTPTRMLDLTRLTVTNTDLEYLTGLEYATNLQYLDLQRNRIRSVGPLSGLTSLTHLDLNNNYIGTISPLSGLTNLTWLDLHDQNREINKFSSISALAGMTKLKYLHIYRHHISNISVLAGMSQMEDLELGQNRISDISPLSGLSKLRRLKLYDNPISDISPLTGLTSLRSVVLFRTSLSQESCTVHIPQIEANNPGLEVSHDCPPSSPQTLNVSSTLGGSVTTPGEGAFTYDYGDEVWLRAFADSGYEFVGWSGDIISDEIGIYIQMTHDYTIQANFAPIPMSNLDELYVEPNGPGDVGPFDPNLSDPDEDGTIEHPFDRIQEAIDMAGEGASVFVGPGRYTEVIDFQGKSIRILSLEPNDSMPAAYPVIDGGGTGPVVNFVSGEDANSLLSGFVITGGRGAVRCVNSRPVLSHCLIVGNRSEEWMAVVDCNTSQLTMVNCTVAHNIGGISLMNSGLEMKNSIVWGNLAPKDDNVFDEIALMGESFALISYSDVAPANSPFQVGVENIYLDPLFVRPGYWANEQGLPVLNSGDADAVWTMGDYHLQSQTGRWDAFTGTWVADDMTSPCINMGDPNDGVDHEPMPNGEIINMGAYGGTSQASSGE